MQRVGEAFADGSLLDIGEALPPENPRGKLTC
jgi:hypothetical protein